jgi:7,8-dihydro-6-hydroxymethylpterin dimethyltransferase
MKDDDVETFVPAAWTRLDFEGAPVYVRDCSPCWFVPNAAGDRLLQQISAGASVHGIPCAERFLERLPPGGRSDFPGRSACLTAVPLRELWIHLTQRCNMACRHCLFASSPEQRLELASGEALTRVDQAGEMGCRLFALTGGEPFIHPGFSDLADAILKRPETHLVVLTNGSCLKQHRKDLIRWGFERFHLQVSMDGMPPRHDAVRGAGAFKRLSEQLAFLRSQGFPFTLSMCVDAENVFDMPGFVETAAELGASNVHFLWLFVRGRAAKDRFTPPDRILEALRQADASARRMGIGLDNIEAFRTQVFAPPGTIHDGTTSGWESAAIGPDGHLYPSAALVGLPELATPVGRSLADAWENSRTLDAVRHASAQALDTPLKFITGGGDSDHSYTSGNRWVGADPYEPLYENIVLWLMTRAAEPETGDTTPHLRLKMGDILENCGAHGSVALVHSNCLLATAQQDSRTSVKAFYSKAAASTQEEILNPACYPEEMMAHIPPELRFRGYGCGSPVLDARPQPGDRVVDLGCGRGIECYIASRLVGQEGRVIGVDMLDPMLEIAREGAATVSRNLGYENLEFREGYLESLPLEENAADLVLSNCVLNLSTHKRHTFSEIFRVLKRGGRLVVSDVVCETEPGSAIRNDDLLRGECIAGALTHRDLVGLLDEVGFAGFRLIRRVPYRDVLGHRFFSMTYEALKPSGSPWVHVIYRGPMRAVQSYGGRMLFAGIPAVLPEEEARRMGEEIVMLDDLGTAVNLTWESSCACAVASDSAPPSGPPADRAPVAHLQAVTGCMVCGRPLTYLEEDRAQACVYCGNRGHANAVCESGHYVCDVCHAAGALAVIEHLCRTTKETDLLALMRHIRTHPNLPMHGPEHHSLVPGVILATYRNLGGRVTPGMLDAGLQRGGRVMGGACAFLGSCGAAAGVGIAFSLILDANPLKPAERQRVMRAVNEVAGAIADVRAARCCQRDAWIALRKAAELSSDLLPITLHADAASACAQQAQNPQCIGSACPLDAAYRKARETPGRGR